MQDNMQNKQVTATDNSYSLLSRLDGIEFCIAMRKNAAGNYEGKQNITLFQEGDFRETAVAAAIYADGNSLKLRLGEKSNEQRSLACAVVEKREGKNFSLRTKNVYLVCRYQSKNEAPELGIIPVSLGYSGRNDEKKVNPLTPIGIEESLRTPGAKSQTQKGKRKPKDYDAVSTIYGHEKTETGSKGFDIIEAYFREMKRTPIPTREQEIEIAKRMETAKDRMICSAYSLIADRLCDLSGQEYISFLKEEKEKTAEEITKQKKMLFDKEKKQNAKSKAGVKNEPEELHDNTGDNRTEELEERIAREQEAAEGQEKLRTYEQREKTLKKLLDEIQNTQYKDRNSRKEYISQSFKELGYSIQEVIKKAKKFHDGLSFREIKIGPILYEDIQAYSDFYLLRREFLGSQRRYEAVRNEMMHGHLRFVVSIAKKYVNQGLELSELIQEGNLGLIRAAERYEWRRGFKFSTYATWWVRQSVTRAIADLSRTIRVPVHLRELRSQYRKTYGLLMEQLERKPTPEEIAKQMDVPLKRLENMLNGLSPIISLETPVGDEDSCISDFVDSSQMPGRFYANPEEIACSAELCERMPNLLSSLTEREERIMRLRYGILDGEEYGRDHTLEETGALIESENERYNKEKSDGITRERARQIELIAMRKLRNSLKNKIFES